MGLTIFAGGNVNPNDVLSMNGNRLLKAGKGGALFAGDSYLAQDPIEQKRKEAREKAWKVVSNAWEADKSIDASIQERRDRFAQLQELEKEANASLNDIHQKMDTLKEQYKIDPESQEQKDLELLMKQQDVKNGVSTELLTPEEMEALKNIDMDNLSDYQKQMLELNDQSAVPRKELQDIKVEMKDINNDLYAIKQERLKKHTMVDAGKEADKILEAASDEIQGMLRQEAMDKVDEDMREQKEKAEKAAEKKEEEEERLEELKEKRAIEEALIEGTKEAVERAKAIEREHDAPEVEIGDMMDMVVKNNPGAGDASQSLESLKNSMALLEADLKGIKVDESV